MCVSSQIDKILIQMWNKFLPNINLSLEMINKMYEEKIELF